MTNPAPARARTTSWWQRPRFWYFALPFVTGGFASCVPALWVASKVEDTQLKARLYVTAGVTALLALLGGVLIGAAPVPDASGNSPGPGDDIGVALMIVAIGVGTWTAVVHRRRAFPASKAELRLEDPHSLLPGVKETKLRREMRAQYRSLAQEDPALALEMNLGRPDLPNPFNDGGLIDLNALDASALERFARVTHAEALSIVDTRNRLGRLSSVDELVVHGDLTMVTADRLRGYAIFVA